jgi:hypothetical protein
MPMLGTPSRLETGHDANRRVLAAEFVWLERRRKTAMWRKRVLANGGLLEVHLGACQQAVVDFMFAAIAGICEWPLSGRESDMRLTGLMLEKIAGS